MIVRVAGLVFADYIGGTTVRGRDRGLPGSDLWVSDNGTTSHIISDPRFVHTYMINDYP